MNKKEIGEVKFFVYTKLDERCGHFKYKIEIIFSPDDFQTFFGEGCYDTREQAAKAADDHINTSLSGIQIIDRQRIQIDGGHESATVH